MRNHHPLGAPVLRAALGTLIVATALAWGGAHPPIQLALALLLIGAWLAYAALNRSAELLPGPMLRFSPVCVLVGAAFLLTLVQLVPLPMRLVGILAPEAWYMRTLPPGPIASFAPLSMDPPATALEAARLAGFFAAAALGPAVFNGRRRGQLLVWIAGAGAVVALWGCMRALSGAGSGLVLGRFSSTFVNPNHLAAFLGLASVTSVGLALALVGQMRLVFLAVGTLTGAGVIATLSRGAIISLALTPVLLAVGMLIRQKVRLKIRRSFQLALVATIGVAAYLSYTAVIQRMATLADPASWERFTLWAKVPAILADFPVLGVGRGAFALVYPHYYNHGGFITYTHLENSALQALVDFGPLPGLGLVVGATWLFTRLLSRNELSPRRLGAGAALLFLAIQNLGDFSLELSSVALVAVLILSVYLPAERANGSTPGPRHGLTPRPFVDPARRRNVGELALPAAMLAAAVLCGAVALPNLIDTDTTAFKQVLSAKGLPAEKRGAEIVAVTERHRADYLLPLLVAQHELDQVEGARNALPWINRGMYLAPGFGGGHLLAGRALWRLGHTQQALLEYGLTLRVEPGYTGAVTSEVSRLRGRAEDVVALAGTDPGTRLALASYLNSTGHVAAALILLSEEPGAPSAAYAELRMNALYAAGQLDRAAAEANQAIERWPARSFGYLWLARLQRQQGNAELADRTLARGLAASSDRDEMLNWQARWALEAGQFERARGLIRQLLANTVDGARRAAVEATLAYAYELEQRPVFALREYEKAGDLAADNPSYPLAVARIRIAIGDFDGAGRALVKAQALARTDALKAEVTRLQALATSSKNQRMLPAMQ